MGHQIRFYLSENDKSRFEELLLSEDAVILHNRSPGPAPRILKSLDLIENGQRWYFFNLARVQDLDAIKIKEVPTQGYWVIEDLPSPVIEFSRCVVAEDAIKQGRLYYTDSDYDRSGLLVTKSPEFREWAKKILSKARRSLKFDKKGA